MEPERHLQKRALCLVQAVALKPSDIRVAAASLVSAEPSMDRYFDPEESPPRAHVRRRSIGSASWSRGPRKPAEFSASRRRPQVELSHLAVSHAALPQQLHHVFLPRLTEHHSIQC